MYRDLFGEFVCGYWGLKGSIAPSENCQKSSKVAGTFSEIPVLTRQKSHVFDSEKV